MPAANRTDPIFFMIILCAEPGFGTKERGLDALCPRHREAPSNITRQAAPVGACLVIMLEAWKFAVSGQPRSQSYAKLFVVYFLHFF